MGDLIARNLRPRITTYVAVKKLRKYLPLDVSQEKLFPHVILSISGSVPLSMKFKRKMYYVTFFEYLAFSTITAQPFYLGKILLLVINFP